MTIILKLIGVLSALILMGFVILLIRQKKLTDEYATLWLTTSILFFLGSIFSKEIFLFYAHIRGSNDSGLGILLFFTVIMIIFLLIIITSKISTQQEQIKNITQKIGLIDNTIEQSYKWYPVCYTSKGNRNTQLIYEFY